MKGIRISAYACSPHLDFQLWFDFLPLPGSWMPQVFVQACAIPRVHAQVRAKSARMHAQTRVTKIVQNRTHSASKFEAAKK